MTGVQQLFPRSSFVGFDHLLNELDNAVRHANDHYPPHNIIRTGESNYLIELAVAGFPKDALTIEVKDRTLTIAGDFDTCLLYTSPSPRDKRQSRMPSSA